MRHALFFKAIVIIQSKAAKKIVSIWNFLFDVIQEN